jgi:hypothetical protein
MKNFFAGIIEPFQNTSLHLIAAITITIVTVIAHNVRAILAFGDLKAGVPENSALQFANGTTDGVLIWLSNLPFADSVSLGLFFVIIGICLYIAYIETTNIYIIARNEISLEHSSSNKRTKRYFVFRGVIKIALAVIAGLFLITSVRTWIPSLLETTEAYFLQTFSRDFLAQFIVSCLVLTLVVYCLLVLAYRTFLLVKKV